MAVLSDRCVSPGCPMRLRARGRNALTDGDPRNGRGPESLSFRVWGSQLRRIALPVKRRESLGGGGNAS